MTETKRNHNLSERLLRYSAAASLMASGTIAAGALPIAATTLPQTLNAGESLAINLNGTGGPEFTIRVESGPGYGYIDLVSFASGASTSVSLAAKSLPGGSIWPYAIWQNASITSGAANWVPVVATDTAIMTNSGVQGFWTGIESYTRYLGVKFQESGVSYTAWLELTITDYNTPGGPSVVISAENAVAGPGLPADVSIMGAQATSGLQAAAASGFAALGGILTWLRRKLLRA